MNINTRWGSGFTSLVLFLSAMSANGQPKTGSVEIIHKDIYPLIKKAFQKAKNNGYLKTTSFEDIAIESTNLGWGLSHLIREQEEPVHCIIRPSPCEISTKVRAIHDHATF